MPAFGMGRETKISDPVGSAGRQAGLRSVQSELMLHLLEGNAFGFGVDEQHHEKLQKGHARKKYERVSAGTQSGDVRKRQRDRGVGDPVRGAAQALALGAHSIRKYF